MKRVNRPSGAQQRKKQKSKILEDQSLASSMLRFVKPTSTTHEGVDISDTHIATSSQSETDGGIEFDELADITLEDGGKEGEGEGSRNIDAGSECSDDRISVDKEADTETVEDEEVCGNEVLYSDISNWPLPVPDKLRIDLIKKGNEPFQNENGPFVSLPRNLEDKTKGTNRQFTSDWFYINQPNGERVKRTWMAYSTKNHTLYCFCCRLFATNESLNKQNKSKFVTGFQAWWKLNPKIRNHETSDQHDRCYNKWKTLQLHLKANKTIDAENQAASEIEKRKWRDILKRLLDVALFLAGQNLPFRGHRENMLSENRGNFLELIELLSKYDPVLREHVTKLELSKQSTSHKILTSYLSPTTQNEFILLLSGMVKERILNEIKNAKYFSIIFDSTPDVSHIDQMSEVIRYVHIENKKVEVKESFLRYYELTGKKALDITQSILNAIEEDGLDITNCRGQGYDNASTMAGVHSGVQARIRELNPKALFVPCANHSLNLCGIHSFATVPSCVTFFGTLERLYVFFSSSTHRWDILLSKVEVTVKRLAETRWSAHYDAVKPVFKCFSKIVDAIEELCDSSETIDTRGAAQTLLPAVCDFSFLCYLYLWNSVLEEVNHTQKYLQTVGLSFEKCLFKMRNLKAFLVDTRVSLVEKAIEFGKAICDEMDIPIVKRRNMRKKKLMPGEKAADEPLTLEDELKRSMLECIDTFQQEVTTRYQGMEDISLRFAILETGNLLKSSETELPKLVSSFVDTYKEISSEDMINEIPRMRRLLQAANVSEEEALKWSSLRLLQFIVEYELQDSIPNLTLAFRFYLTLCVSVASCERSFSKLKLIKSYLRSTMNQARLSGLAILSIENRVAKEIDFNEAISLFAENKVRKKRF